ncbi:MAG TPA: aldo/keto reductase [Acidimicrobiales bacterium]|nr:aldo/keto reductase [Acidimicrobiales bacterium]
MTSGRLTDLPRVGLGAAPLGGLFAAVDDETATATVDTAVRLGMTYIDTAPLYGYGLSEQRVGAALAALGHDPVVSTKVGRLVAPAPRREPGDLFVGAPPGAATFDFTADGIRASLAASLARLQRPAVDIALLHDPDDHLDVALTEGIRALQDLREEGVVGAIGVGVNHCATAIRAVRDAPVDVVLIAGRWTLLDRSAAADLLPRCADRGVTVVAGGVFNSGALADPGAGTFDYGAVPPPVRARIDALQAACDRFGVPLAAAAIQHPLRHPAVAAIVVGCRSPDEVATNAALLEVVVPDDLWAALDEIGTTAP